ncbi:hypothetical protein KFL_000890040 [Klebsormidium nitens]|uniref:F-box domain-containing protein n=1 Tax=Klebsormidium nitens TaxID=105231 RepID=A0A1Y1HYX9_KLENI|nr:hypothetical protein KFL_000890040 [Klebsormidium nitens]|eukprot:GAQ81716.1 hypothetical protein KFL_000890040 [Klebsormidium nitens]
MEPIGGSPFDRLPDELLRSILERRMWDAGDLHFSKSQERIQLELVCKRFQALVRSSPSLEWDVIGLQSESIFWSYMLARTTTSLQKVSLVVENVSRLLTGLEAIVAQSEETLEELHVFIVASSDTSCADYEKLFAMLQACPKLAVLELVLFRSKVDLDFVKPLKPYQSLRLLLLDGFRVHESALNALLETFPLLRNQKFEKPMNLFNFTGPGIEEPSWSNLFWWDSKSGVTQCVAPVPRTPRLVLMIIEREPRTHALDKLKGLMVGCRAARVASNLPGYLDVLVALMTHDNQSIRRFAGHTLFHIVNDDDTRKVLTRVGTAVEGLLEYCGQSDLGAQLRQRIALKILGLLACDGQSKEATAAFLQRVEVLNSLLEKGTLDEVEDAMFQVDTITEDLGPRRLIARMPSFMKALVFCMASRPEEKARELGAFRLQCMAEDEKLLQEIASGPECLQALLSVLNSGSEDVLATVAAVLCNLASNPMAREVIAVVPRALPWLVILC